MLLLLHGIGSNERGMAALAPHLDPRLLVLSVRSPLAIGPDAFAWFRVTFTPQGPVVHPDEAAQALETLPRFAEEAVQAYGADPARVFVAGFSQGGIMALGALLVAPERFAGAAMMSGRLPPEVLTRAAPAARLAGKPVLVLHGTQDATLPVAFARQARDELARLPVDLAYLEFAMGHTVSLESLSFAAGWLAGQLDRPAA